MRFGGDAHGHVLEVRVAPCRKATFGIAETRHQIKLEADLLQGGAGVEQLQKFKIFIDRPDGFNEAWPVGGFEKVSLPCCFMTCESTTSLL